MSGVIYPYRFSVTTTAPPGEAQVRGNAAGFGASVTTIWLHNKNDDTTDVHVVLMKISSGSELVVQDKTNHNNAVTFTATADAVDKGTYVEVPVTFVSAQGSALTGNQQILAVLYAAPAPDPPTVPGSGTPPDFSYITLPVALVSLAEAKAHLRITDTAHDADVTVILDAAQDQILAKLGVAADATWTDTTAPKPVRHAIKILLDAFYERRGGDEVQDPLKKALETVDLLLALYRDPTLA